MFVLGISGYKGSGKDTFADMVGEVCSSSHIRKISLAMPLKKACMEDYGLSRGQCYDQSLKELPILDRPLVVKDGYAKHAMKNIYEECRTADQQKPSSGYRINPDGSVFSHEHGSQLYWTPRALMIFKGSNQRTVDSDYWIKKLKAVVEKDHDSDLFLIPDVRYRNEVESLQNIFGNSFKVVRINGRVEPQSNDPSERDLDDYSFDHYIVNDGGLDDLRQKVTTLMDILEID